MQKNMSKAAKAKEKDSASGGGDEFEDDPATEADEGNYTYPGAGDHLDLDDDDDEKENQPTGRSIFGRGGRKTDIKASPFGDLRFNKSDTTLKALSDPNSELARFLLTKRGDDMKWKSMRSI